MGQRIRVLREKLSLTQEQLAEKAGISVSYLSMIERAQRTPHVETLVAISEALGVTVSQLFLDVNESGDGGQAQDLPLMAYLGTRNLDRNELEDLLKVAKAMFDDKS
jgi:transcriptional regulator with XRE-family HTH domain